MIYLGNLTIQQMEERLGITLSDDERDRLNALREEYCNNVAGNEKIHVYDIPFCIECGNPSARKTVIDILTPYAKKMKTPIQIGGGI